MTLTAEANETLDRLELYGVRLGLEATRAVMEALDNPHLGFPAVLVAGSNGKGSTASLLAAMATAAGNRTGLYTSPHLEDVEERIRIDGVAVSGTTLSRDLSDAVDAAERALGHPPTYFEAMTAAGFLRFSREDLDLAILEVGVGGRLDATNVVDPVLSLITEIGFDHRKYLGDTLESIAREKAGIMRPGRPTLAWVSRREARCALEEVAGELGAELSFASDRVQRLEGRNRGEFMQEVEIEAGELRGRFDLHLLGRHQSRNLGLALLAAELLRSLGWPALDLEAMQAGVARCRWPGRLERVELPDSRNVLLDSAHNPDGATVLAEYLQDSGHSYSLLFGALADKDVERLLPIIARQANEIVLTSPQSPRAADPEALGRLLPDRLPIVVSDSASALDAALRVAKDDWLVVCGSIYLVGEVRAALRERFSVPAPAVDALY